MMICLDCGNKDVFTQKMYGTCDYSEVAIYTDGDENDACEYDDFDTDNQEQTDLDEMTCGICKSENVIKGLTEAGRLEIISIHTKKDGTWSKEQLKEPNKDIIAAYVADKI